ncbi:MAG: 50S ribosomal protein L15 [Candidatus Midichloria sp.]|uniref:Large ribosomal subunit protein uL15m n=1 Tax=Hyalomma marginatum TaxID=34627 RepID=A0A8S4C0D7_9ACAR|nr:50S ribosomal protein L15 [Hyalomma marginatum]CAG7591344.1 50S ribosomal protein L15 [Hyalomma marginatum]
MLNLLRDNPGARKKSKALGRGIGSGKGKTSARGGKGQTARTGVALNGFEGGQTPLHRRLPKRGFKSINKTIFEVINLQDIENIIADKKITSNEINEETLKDLGFLSSHNKKIKLLGKGTLNSKVSIRVHAVSTAARTAIESLGGKVEII